MDLTTLSELRTWLTEAGLAGKSETVLPDGFCRRALDASLPIARAVIIIDTLHPVHEGRAFFWRRDAGQAQIEQVEYGPTSEGEAAENWHRSVLFHLLRLVSVGRYALRGVERPQELFTLAPFWTV